MGAVSIRPGLVFLEPVTEEQTTQAGIILAETSSSFAGHARITHIHPDTSSETGFEPGMRVLVNPYAVREVALNAAEMRLAIVPGDILATIEEA